METDKRFIRAAFDIARSNIPKGGGPFGAVVVRDGVIISQAANSVVIDNDPTAHAEVNAIRKASELLSTWDLSDCTLYSSCEPCPMCFGAIHWAGIRKVVYGGTRDSAARAGFSDKFIYEEISLFPDTTRVEFRKILTEEAERVFDEWISYDGRTQY